MSKSHWTFAHYLISWLKKKLTENSQDDPFYWPHPFWSLFFEETGRSALSHHPSFVKPCPCFALLALSYLLRIAMASITSHPQGLELEGTGSNLGLVLSWACSPHGSHSVQFSCSVMSDSLWPHEPQHTRPPCPSPTPRVHSNPCPLSQWCHPTISFSVVPFFSCPQSFPASGSFQMS